MNELDAPAASARVPQRVIRVPRVPADPTHVALVLIVVVADLARARARARAQAFDRSRRRRALVAAMIGGDLLHRRVRLIEERDFGAKLLNAKVDEIKRC